MQPEPYFQTTAADARRPRLLLLSKHFPPSEEAGALRWQKLAALVADRGWDLDVVALDPSELARKDDGRLTELPSGVRAFGVATPPMVRDRIERAIARLLASLPAGRPAPGGNGAQTAPDAGVVANRRPNSIGHSEAHGPLHGFADLRRAFHAAMWRARELAWAKAAGRAALSASKGTRPIAVVSCGPPHHVHLAGARLARQHRVPFIMDMRDPWSLVERVPEPFGSRRFWRNAERDEARCLLKASLIVVNTEAHRRALQRRYPTAAPRVIAILNGFDDEPVVAPPASEMFTVAYAGTIYLDRDPRPLLSAIAMVIKDRRLTPAQFRVVFLGDIQDYGGHTMPSLVADAGLEAFVEIQGRRARREALAELSKADILVVLPQDSHLAVPSKVFEYMLFPAWILALAPDESSIATLLVGSGADVVHPENVRGIAAVIGQRLDEKAASGRPRPMASLLPHLSRTAQGARLLDAIAALVTRNV